MVISLSFSHTHIQFLHTILLIDLELQLKPGIPFLYRASSLLLYLYHLVIRGYDAGICNSLGIVTRDSGKSI